MTLKAIKCNKLKILCNRYFCLLLIATNFLTNLYLKESAINLQFLKFDASAICPKTAETTRQLIDRCSDINEH